MARLHDTVRLLTDKPELGLAAGAVGAVVHVHTRPSRAYEVEFVDPDGRTVALAALAPHEIAAVDQHEPA